MCIHVRVYRCVDVCVVHNASCVGCFFACPATTYHMQPHTTHSPWRPPPLPMTIMYLPPTIHMHRCLASPAVLVCAVLNGAFVGLQDAVTPLKVCLVAGVLNLLGRVCTCLGLLWMCVWASMCRIWSVLYMNLYTCTADQTSMTNTSYTMQHHQYSPNPSTTPHPRPPPHTHAGDVALIVGLGWGIRGAAVATTISQYAALGYALWVTQRGRKKHIAIPLRWWVRKTWWGLRMWGVKMFGLKMWGNGHAACTYLYITHMVCVCVSHTGSAMYTRPAALCSSRRVPHVTDLVWHGGLHIDDCHCHPLWHHTSSSTPSCIAGVLGD